MMDIYSIGEVTRISPEAPVPVLTVSNQKRMPGGAGNVALNLAALGCEVTAIGRIGNDQEGVNLANALQAGGVNTNSLIIEEAYQTPVKNRFLSSNQQLIRCDYEEIVAAAQESEEAAKLEIAKHIEGCDIVAISDYGKGFLTGALLAFVIERAASHAKKVVVDPKGRDFTKYDGAYLIKPNNMEAYMAANLDKTHALRDVAKNIFNQINCTYLLVTQSEKGMTLIHKKDNKNLHLQNFPITQKEIRDVTGAGDTALAMIILAIANNLPFQEGINLSNLAASLAVSEVGCATISRQKIYTQL